MQFTNWELSNVEPKTEIPLSEGDHTLFIESASFNPDEQIYYIRFASLTNEEECSTLKFFLRTQDNTAYNNAVVGTLNTLTKAIGGPEMKGILAPCDIEHMLVKATVKLSKPKEYNGEVKQFPVIYEFKPVTRAEYEFAKEDGYEVRIQYFVGE